MHAKNFVMFRQRIQRERVYLILEREREGELVRERIISFGGERKECWRFGTLFEIFNGYPAFWSAFAGNPSEGIFIFNLINPHSH